MEKEFSLYLIKIGLLDESTLSLSIKPSGESNDKTFTNSSFYFLMNYFDNLTEEQKKYMSFYIPAKFKIKLKENKLNKIKLLIIQLRLRQKLILLKYLYIWKRNINVFNKNSNNFFNNNNNTNNNTNKKKLEENFNKNIDEYKIEKNDINFNLDLNDEFSIENIDIKDNLSDKNNKDDLVHKFQQISQNTISLDELFTNNPKNKEIKISEKNSNKKNDIHNVKKNINNYNTINIKSYKSLKSYNRKKNRINQLKWQLKSKNISKFIDYNSFKNRRNNKNNTNPKNENESKKPKLYTSLEEKEMEELKECTFHPKINKSRTYNKIRNILSGENISSNILSKKKDIQSTFDKLYNDNEKYKFSREMRTIDHEHILGKNISFTPNLSNNHNFRKRYSKSDKNFEERQKDYLYKKNINYEELKNKIDSDYEKLFSFIPKITNDKGKYYQIKENKNSNISVFQRLYQDFKNRKDSKEKKEIEKNNKFNEISNSLAQKKNINYDLLNKLYDNNKEEIINKIRERVDKEKGITFNPNIEQNDYIKKVDGTFFERNEKWINNKKKFFEEENKKQIENLKRNLGIKEYTKEEKLQMVNNIINRLYINNNYKNSNNVQSKKE